MSTLKSTIVALLGAVTLTAGAAVTKSDLEMLPEAECETNRTCFRGYMPVAISEDYKQIAFIHKSVRKHLGDAYAWYVIANTNVETTPLSIEKYSRFNCSKFSEHTEAIYRYSGRFLRGSKTPVDPSYSTVYPSPGTLEYAVMEKACSMIE